MDILVLSRWMLNAALIPALPVGLLQLPTSQPADRNSSIQLQDGRKRWHKQEKKTEGLKGCTRKRKKKKEMGRRERKRKEAKLDMQPVVIYVLMKIDIRALVSFDII